MQAATVYESINHAFARCKVGRVGGRFRKRTLSIVSMDHFTVQGGRVGGTPGKRTLAIEVRKDDIARSTEFGSTGWHWRSNNCWNSRIRRRKMITASSAHKTDVGYTPRVGNVVFVGRCNWVRQVAGVKDSNCAVYIVAIATTLRLLLSRRWHLCLSTCAVSDQKYRQKRVVPRLSHVARRVEWVGYLEEATLSTESVVDDVQEATLSFGLCWTTFTEQRIFFWRQRN